MNVWTQLFLLPMTTFAYGLDFMVRTLQTVQQTVQQVAPVTGGASRGNVRTTFKETGEMSQNCSCGDQCGKPFCEIRIYEYYIVSVKPGKEEVLQKPSTSVITSDMNGEAFSSYVIGLYCLDNKVSRDDVKYLRVCYRLSCTLPKERESHARDQVEILRQIRDAIGGGLQAA